MSARATSIAWRRQDCPFADCLAETPRRLELTIPRLRWLAFHSEAATVSHHVRFTIPKRSGGTHAVSTSASHASRKPQRWIFAARSSRRCRLRRPAAQVHRRPDILTNAREHANRAIVVNLDLEDFFPSIGFPPSPACSNARGYSRPVAAVLALLCTECPRWVMEYDGVKYFAATGPRGLPQGACTSPGLSNQVARRLDRRLGGLAGKLNISYTRYADDLTFSGDGRRRPGRLPDGAGAAHRRGRRLCRQRSEESRAAAEQCAGRDGVGGQREAGGSARAEVHLLRAILHRARSEGLERQNREGRSDTAWLHAGKSRCGDSQGRGDGAVLLRELEAVLGRA